MLLAINPTQKGITTMSQPNPTLATLGNLQAHIAMMAQLTSSDSSETVTINRQDLQLAFADIEQTISGICAQLSNNTEITFSSSLGEAIDHPMVEQFWDVYDYLESINSCPSLNHHNADDDTIAININDIYRMAKKYDQPLADDMIELKQHLRDSCRYLFIDSNVSVSSQLLNSRTIKCWIFQKSAMPQPTNETPDIDLAQACSEFEQQHSSEQPAVLEMDMTEAEIVRRRVKDDGAVTSIYIPSVPVEKTERITRLGFIYKYGVELPVYYHDIDVSRFCEKTYTDQNGDLQRVLVPKFKDRQSGEHTQAFYQRVGLLLPPID